MVLLSALVFLSVTLGLAGLFLWLTPDKMQQRLRNFSNPGGPTKESSWTETIAGLV